MKARLENDVIKLYGQVPNKFEYTTDKGTFTVVGGGSSLNEKTLALAGFKDVVTPTLDYRIEELSAIKLDGDVYTYDVIEKPIKETLAELKSNKISELKSIAGSMLSATDWYIVRNADTGAEVPQSIKDKRANIRTQSDSIEAEINALSTKKAVVLFDINL